MSLSANKIFMRRQRLYIPVTDFSGWIMADNASPTADDVVSAITSTVIQREISSSGIVGAHMGGAVGGHVRHLMSLPTDWDRDHPVRVRVIWSAGGATATDGATWLLFYEQIAADGSIAVVNDALNTAVPEDFVTANVVAQTSEPGIINGGVLADTTRFLGWDVELDATDVDIGGAESVYLLGLEFEYTPKFDAGYKNESDEWANR